MDGLSDHRQLKPKTLRNYNQRINLYRSDWLDLPITTLTKDMIEQRHRSIPAKAMANSTFRTLAALLHFASFKYEDPDGQPVLKANPVQRLSEVRAWHRDRRRRRIIPISQLRAWMRAVFALKNTTYRDFLLTLLFTGLRNSEARSLQWSNVNLECGTIFIGDPKNGEDFTLPMSSFVRKLFTIRKQRSNSRWVFPGKLKDSHISPGYGSCREVIEQCGVEFSPHDLRRTFITIGDEIDVKAEVVKALVNHKSDDVTEGYTVRSIERLRRSSERITQAIIQYAGMPASPFD